MYNRIEDKLKQGLDSLAPDMLDEIMRREPVRIETEEELLGTYSEGKTLSDNCFGDSSLEDRSFADISSADNSYGNSSWDDDSIRDKSFTGNYSHQRYLSRNKIMRLCALAAVILFVFIGISMDRLAIVDEIYLDVNPSITISLNRSGRTVAVCGNNPEGREVVDSVSPLISKGQDPSSVIVILAEEIKQEGYFRDDEADILISYSYAKEESPEILTDVTESLKTFAEENEMDEVLITQSFPKDASIKKEAKTKGISPGKCVLIKTIKEQNKKQEEEAIAANTVKEIASYILDTGTVLTETQNIYVSSVTTSSEPVSVKPDPEETIRDREDSNATSNSNIVILDIGTNNQGTSTAAKPADGSASTGGDKSTGGTTAAEGTVTPNTEPNQTETGGITAGESSVSEGTEGAEVTKAETDKKASEAKANETSDPASEGKASETDPKASQDPTGETTSTNKDPGASQEPAASSVHVHSYIIEVAAEATCDTDGTVRYTCECGDTYEKTIHATGHSFGEWITDSETESYGSLRHRVCTVCGYTEYETVNP